MPPISADGRAFTMIEMLAATAVSALLLLALSGLIGSSLQSMGHTTRSLQAHDSTTQLLELLRADLRDLSPPSPAIAQPFFLRTSGPEVVLAVVRPDARFHDFQRQGYYRHVEYIWNREERTLTRAVHHAADSVGGDVFHSAPDSSDHRANAERLRALTPALSAERAVEWRGSAEMEAARAAVEEAPLVAGVEEFSVECLTGPDLRSAGRDWTVPDGLPSAVRVRVGFRPSARQAELRVFQLLIPLQSTPPVSSVLP